MKRILCWLPCIPVLLCAALMASCGSSGPDNASTAKCADFRYQEDAQDYFNSHDAKQLDADHDGIACEDLPHRPTTVTPPVVQPVATTAEGLYFGNTSTLRTVIGVVLDNGTYWVIYSLVNNPNVIAGVVNGLGTSLNGSFSSNNALDFNVEAHTITSATVSASYVSKQSLNGVVMYSSQQNLTFTSTYNQDYATVPSLATIAGTYTGTAAVVSATENATLTIASNGVITGQGTSGCRFTGQATTHAKGNIYDLSVSFQGGVCTNGTSTVTGIGYYNATTKRIYGTALNSSRSNGFIFVGTKP